MMKTVYRIHNSNGSEAIATSINPTTIVKTFNDSEACQDYLDGLDSDCIDVSFGSFVKARFFTDLEHKCNLKLQNCIAHADSYGWEFRHDFFYKANAAWKDEPLHYCYSGDFGTSAYFAIDYKDGEIDKRSSAHVIHEDMAWLLACSDTLWELGFVLTFDSAGKHTIMCRRSAYYAEVEQ